MEQSSNKNPGQEPEQEPEQDREGEAHNPAAGDPAAAPGATETAAAGNESAPASNAGDADDAMKNLPVVEAPSVDAAKADEAAAEPVGMVPHPQALEPLAAIMREAADETSEHAAPIGFAAAQARSLRFALLAATIAVVAGVGSFVGGLAAWGIGHREAADAAGPRSAEARNVLQGLNKQLAELNALKASLDTANRSAGTQFAKITERLTSLEHAQAEPAAKLTRLTDAVDRLEKHAPAAPEVTGSITKPAQPQPAAAPAPAANERILNDWIVRDVRNGRALVESRYGGIFVAATGANLPGLGRVESVRRQDGSWIVVTAKGTITSDR